MKIHTHNPELVEQYLDELELKYKIRSIKITDNKVFNWKKLPSFNWDEELLDTTHFVVKLPKDKRIDFFIKFGNKITKLNYIHFEKKNYKYKNYKYEITHEIYPRYPVYVISKGRYEKRLTIDALEEMNCPYKLVIEPSEFEKYNEHVDEKNILLLPEEYLNKNQGGIPARNFVWEHSVQNGFKKHWIIDDNIDGFYRWNYNVQKRIKSGVVFRVLEDYSDRYENVGLSSMSYFYTIPGIDIGRKMLIYNSRCYSCILINSELLDKTLKERWRGRYNEDTDLTLRTLQKNLCTILLNNFLSNKKTSGTMKGGNTDTIYEGGSHSGYLKKFQELKNNFPDIVKLTNKKHVDGRPHHHINYTKLFTTKPILKDEYKNLENVSNEYNMKFIKKKFFITKRNFYIMKKY